MNLDNPWKIVALVAALLVARLLWTLWKQAPSRKTVLEFLDAGLIAFTLVFLLVRPFVVQAFYIPSGSMFPTLKEGDRILVNRFFYRFNPPERGDIIVFEPPPMPCSPESEAGRLRKASHRFAGRSRADQAGRRRLHQWEEVPGCPGTDLPGGRPMSPPGLPTATLCGERGRLSGAGRQP